MEPEPSETEENGRHELREVLRARFCAASCAMMKSGFYSECDGVTWEDFKQMNNAIQFAF